MPDVSSHVILRTFATPVAKARYPLAEEFNPAISELVMSKLTEAEKNFGYKSETLADMTRWGEPVIDSLTTWVFGAAVGYIKADGSRRVVAGQRGSKGRGGADW